MRLTLDHIDTVLNPLLFNHSFLLPGTDLTQELRTVEITDSVFCVCLVHVSDGLRFLSIMGAVAETSVQLVPILSISNAVKSLFISCQQNIKVNSLFLSYEIKGCDFLFGFAHQLIDDFPYLYVHLQLGLTTSLSFNYACSNGSSRFFQVKI